MAKLDFDSIVMNVKQMINPTGQTPQPGKGDSLGIKLAKLSTSIQLVAQIQAEQTKEFAKINQLANEIFNDVQAMRGDGVSQADEVKKEKSAKPSDKS